MVIKLLRYRRPSAILPTVQLGPAKGTLTKTRDIREIR